MCDYQGYEFGAGKYPDSLCIDGKLFDADNCDDDGNLYDSGEDIPCPICRPDDAIRWWADRNVFFVDDESDDDAACERKARDAAISLVNDIRANRGLANATQGERHE